MIKRLNADSGFFSETAFICLNYFDAVEEGQTKLEHIPVIKTDSVVKSIP